MRFILLIYNNLIFYYFHVKELCRSFCFKGQCLTLNNPKHDPVVFDDVICNMHPAGVKSSIVLLHLVNLETVFPSNVAGVGALHPLDPLLHPVRAPVLQTAFLLPPNGAALQKTSRDTRSGRVWVGQGSRRGERGSKWLLTLSCLCSIRWQQDCSFSWYIYRVARPEIRPQQTPLLFYILLLEKKRIKSV